VIPSGDYEFRAASYLLLAVNSTRQVSDFAARVSAFARGLFIDMFNFG
jgi:hypothetical protein